METIFLNELEGDPKAVEKDRDPRIDAREGGDLDNSGTRAHHVSEALKGLDDWKLHPFLSCQRGPEKSGLARWPDES